MSQPIIKIGDRPATGTVGNLLANPGAFLSATFGLMFLLVVKVLVVRRRPPGPPES